MSVAVTRVTVIAMATGELARLRPEGTGLPKSSPFKEEQMIMESHSKMVTLPAIRMVQQPPRRASRRRSDPSMASEVVDPHNVSLP